MSAWKCRFAHTSLRGADLRHDLFVSAIADAELQIGRSLPKPLRLIYEGGDGRFRQDGEWWVIWPLDRVIVDNQRAWREGRLPRSLLAFGDDGTGDPFCVRLDEDTNEVLRWSWIDSAPHGSEGTMADFLRSWIEGG